MSGTNSALGLAVFCLYLWITSQIGPTLKLLILVGLWYFVAGGRDWLRIFRATYSHTLTLIYRYVGLKLDLLSKKNKNVVQLFRATAKKHRGKVAFIDAGDGRQWKYEELEAHSNRVANYFLGRGFKKGDVVALFMENRTEYVALWLGLAKIGVVPALINNNLRSDSLIHTITVASCKAIIYGLEIEQAVREVLPKLTEWRQSANNNEGDQSSPLPLFCSSSGSGVDGGGAASNRLSGAVDLDEALRASSGEEEPAGVARQITPQDPLLYIYTSGTTGLPKAVVIKHVRQTFACIAAIYTLNVSVGDRMYTYLPLYHASGGQLGCAFALFNGTTTVIRKKFSASNFWKDCVKHNITVSQYIGEVCHYLLSAPEVSEERAHRVRLMFGNGLRAAVWTQFARRFGVADLYEVYGSTEGNTTLLNIANRPGACGFLVPWLGDFLGDKLLGLHLIRVDAETRQPIRDKSGFCVKANPGEPGEIIGRIVKGDPVKDFEGYKDSGATRKKILRDVFAAGDAFFRSGDLLTMDELGFVYFQDRAGDTFRWKGENVSTQEVESAAMEASGAVAVCYGVTVPECGGRAGMLAVPERADDGREVDLARLAQHLREKLPAYARPIFVRVAKELQMTGTFKLKKTVLQSEGFDVSKIKEPIYIMDKKLGNYVELTQEMLKDINAGKIRF